MNSEFLPIAVAIVEHQGSVLIGPRRAGSALAGLWEFPGGKVEPGEEPAAAARRECLEETGLTVRIVGLACEVSYRYDHAQVRIQFFDAEPEDPLVRPHAPFVWVPISSLSEYAFPPANVEAIARLLRRSSKS